MASSPDRWQRLEALFHEALELKPGARSEFLDKNCGEDQELRKEVESLLDSAEKPMDFLQKPVLDAAQEMIADERREMISPGTELGHYKIISQLGAGGMGEVYLAEDTRLRRKVALKMIVPELASDNRGLQRFEQEAHAASALNHPNILTIYEFGQANGLHFIASEFIEGQTLRSMTLTGKLGLNAAVDIAIQIAHKAGVQFRSIIETDNVVATLNSVGAGLGFSLLPDYVRTILPANVVSRPLAVDTPPALDLLLAYRTDSVSPALDIFLSIIRKQKWKWEDAKTPAREK